MEKLIIDQKLCEFCIEKFPGKDTGNTIDDFLAAIKSQYIIALDGEDWHDNIHFTFDPYDAYITVYCTREEYDDEYQQRLKQETKKREKDLKELARLKALYEPV